MLELTPQDVDDMEDVLCLVMDPVVGFTCTRPALHDGDHVASCGPGGEPGAIWPRTEHERHAQRTVNPWTPKSS